MTKNEAINRFCEITGIKHRHVPSFESKADFIKIVGKELCELEIKRHNLNVFFNEIVNLVNRDGGLEE